MTETINDRIEQILNAKYNGNKAAFAKSIGLLPTGLSNYLSKARRSKPGVDMIAKIVEVTGVDARWLLLGEETSAGDNNTVTTSGAMSPASVSGNITMGGESVVLMERVQSLERLLEKANELIADKERTIKILLNR